MLILESLVGLRNFNLSVKSRERNLGLAKYPEVDVRIGIFDLSDLD